MGGDREPGQDCHGGFALTEDYWTPEPIFTGRRVFIMASGPSLTPAVCEKVRGRPSIVVNSSMLMAPWADLLFFNDTDWFLPRAAQVAAWPGLAVTVSRRAKEALPRLKRLRVEFRPSFPPAGHPTVRLGKASGQTAVALAIACGASEVVLLGYDMRAIGRREHCHDDYRGLPRREASIYETFAAQFAGWNADALKAGVTIVNATPGSALAEFPRGDIEEWL